MYDDQKLEEVAERLDISLGTLLYNVVKYLVEDPRLVNSHVRIALRGATDGEIQEALEAIIDDTEREELE